MSVNRQVSNMLMEALSRYRLPILLSSQGQTRGCAHLGAARAASGRAPCPGATGSTARSPPTAPAHTANSLYSYGATSAARLLRLQHTPAGSQHRFMTTCPVRVKTVWSPRRPVLSGVLALNRKGRSSPKTNRASPSAEGFCAIHSFSVRPSRAPATSEGPLGCVPILC